MIDIIHISDLHLGKVFSNYSDNIKKALQEARFESLEKIVDYGNDQGADLIIIAGDLFDRLNVKKEIITRTCSILRAFNGLTLTLPGNHDYYSGNEDLWKTYQENMGDNNILLKEFRSYDLEEYGIDAMVYPAFCHSKHSKENNLGWIKNAQIDLDSLNIGISHGALEGLSPDMQGDYFTMTKEELRNIPMDLWLLGHSHAPYPESGQATVDRIYNAGTHEPDGMNYSYGGSAFHIRLDSQDIESKKIITGKYKFEDRYDRLDTDLRTYLSSFEEGYEDSLLRLNISGYIDEEDYVDRYEMYKSLGDKVFYLRVRDEGLKIRLSPEKISEKFVHGSFPEKFLLRVQDDEDRLQLAYDLIEESRD